MFISGIYHIYYADLEHFTTHNNQDKVIFGFFQGDMLDVFFERS